MKFWEGASISSLLERRGQRGLEQALSQLTQASRVESIPKHFQRCLSEAIEISDELTGQPHDLESLIVQEFVDHDLELRLYVVNGEVETTIFTKFCKIKPNNEFGDFKATNAVEDTQNVQKRRKSHVFEVEGTKLDSRSNVGMLSDFEEAFTSTEAAEWIGGDLATLEDGERQCRSSCSPDFQLRKLEIRRCSRHFDAFLSSPVVDSAGNGLCAQGDYGTLDGLGADANLSNSSRRSQTHEEIIRNRSERHPLRLLCGPDVAAGQGSGEDAGDLRAGLQHVGQEGPAEEGLLGAHAGVS